MPAGNPVAEVLGMRRILCPVDFSPGSERAMRVGVRLANEHDAELVLFHAWQVPATTGDFAFATGVVADLGDVARETLDQELRRATELGAKKASAKLVSGPAWSMIVEELRDGSIDLVVMGTQGRTGLRRILLGSVAEKVVRHAPCPVLTIRPEGELAPFRKILVPVDFSADSQRAMEVAADMIARDGTGITLLHIVEIPVAYRGRTTLPGAVEALDKRGAEALDAWATVLRAKVSVPVSTEWHIGSPGTEVLAVLDEDRSYDLVVTGSHGRTGVRRVLIGSVAEKIVRYSPCPVLVARRPETAESS
jgi:nucleotide-binding universal stress UspA family protein